MNSALIEMGDLDINERRLIQPIGFHFSEEFINTTKERLETVKHTFAISKIVSDLDEFLNYMIQYWIYEYDFYEQELVFNRYPQFYTIIDDLKIHYIHVTPFNPDKKPVYPLLMLHGWPSSILEFYDVIPSLVNATEVNDFIFELIIPSLPGFGGSDCPSNENLNCEFIAELLVKFMEVLGFDKFYVHCDDWCVFVVHAMSFKYSANLLAIHYSLCQVKQFPAYLPIYASTRIMNIRKAHEQQQILKDEYYNSPTSLCTLTLGISLQHSPGILMTYLFEKFLRDSVHADTRNILNNYDCYQLLNNVMMYWATNSITKTLKAYSGYFTFKNEELSEDDFFKSQNNNFVAVSLFLPERVRPDIIQGRNIFCIFKNNSFRFPAIEDSYSLSCSLFQTFNHFLAQNNSD